MTFKELHSEFQDKHMYLPVFLENKFDESHTETDHRKRAKQLNTFMKRLNAITFELDNMFDIQNSIATCMREIQVIDVITCNEVGIAALAKAYGSLGVHVERLQKFMNKNKKSLPEAVEFWSDSSILSLNCFDFVSTHAFAIVAQLESGERKSVNWERDKMSCIPEGYKEGYKSEKKKLS